jgi:hypothetical protein
MNTLAGGLSGRSNISSNVSILFSAIGISLAFIGLYISTLSTPLSSLAQASIIFVTSFILILELLYAAYELYKQFTLAWQNHQVAAKLCTSALLGCFLLGLISFLYSDILSPKVVSSGPGVALSLCSMICLLFVIALKPQGTTVQLSPPPALPVSVPYPNTFENTLENSKQTGDTFEPPPIEFPPGLDPEFLDNLMNYIPHPYYSRLFSCAKTGDRPLFSEDACVISPDESYFALCDGASGSELPRSWAILLGKQWLKAPLHMRTMIDAKTLSQWLAEPQKYWVYWVQEIWWREVNTRNRSNHSPLVSRRAVDRILSKGAASTFLGLQLDHKNAMWRATAIGDTCLFSISRTQKASPPELRPIMPITVSTSFNQTPPLLSSKMDSEVDDLPSQIQCLQGTYHSGEHLLMATDALAKWLLIQCEQRRLEWQLLLSMRTQEQFAGFIEELRKHDMVEEDDMTVVIIPLIR